MPTFAAVDIGANSVRLKIARLVHNHLQVLHEDREVTRLGEAVFHSGVLAPQAIAHTVKVLRRFHRAVQSHGADLVRVVATSALRDAGNAAAFREWVRSATGWKVEVISGLEEGRLIHLGIMSGARIAASQVLLVDLGGGSCELTLSRDRQIRQMFSLPLGAVRLTQEFLPHDPPKRRELERLRGFIAEELERARQHIHGKDVQVTIATSGTAAALAAFWAAARQRGHRGRNPRTVPRAALAKLASELARHRLEERANLPGIGPRRAEIIIAGATVFAEMLNRLNLASFRYLPLGLRDGVLAQMAADYGSNTPMRRQIESQRGSALLSLGRHYGVDLKYAERVRRHAEQLFAKLKALHRLPAEYREWLAAAAMLQDVGSYINRAGRHRHTHYILAHSEIFGYNVRQRRLIAAIARYIGNSRPARADQALRVLPSEDRESVPKAVMLLRLARALDQGRRGAIAEVSVRVEAGRVVLRPKVKRAGADLELWALRKERSYFRDVFGRELVPTLS